MEKTMNDKAMQRKLKIEQQETPPWGNLPAPGVFLVVLIVLLLNDTK